MKKQPSATRTDSCSSTSSEDDGCSSCSTQHRLLMLTALEGDDDDEEEQQRATTTEPLFAPLQVVDWMADDEQDSCATPSKSSSSNHSNSPVSLRRVARVLCWQLVVGLAIGRFAPKIGHRFVNHQCRHRLVDRPAPYSLDESGNLVLFEHLNKPKGPSTVSKQTLKWTSQRLPEMLIVICSWIFAKTNKHTKNDPLRPVPLFSLGSGFLVSLPVRRIMEICAAFSGIYTSLGVSMFLTHMLKTVGRRRPKFYSMCQFDVDARQCTGTPEQICSAQFSFPSGHSSLAACSMVFLCCYCCGKLSSTRRSRTHRWLVCAVCGSWAVFVAWSRVADHWHNPTDVLAGLLLGTLTALAVYRVHYPPPFTPQAAFPKTVLALEQRHQEQCSSSNHGAPGEEEGGGDESKLRIAVYC